ncbi:NTP transferase domain-containing protein [Clostridium lundense]|uniref:NTP transferase domain-containing protein n=1 Tax=Clostridium lundense TaxID=319475 RepID=UPI0009FFD4FB|nr:NTP transferase domain-containing protein [Clostridium lundense]
MNLKELKVLKILNLENKLSQRKIAEKAEVSLGTVNNIINFLIENDYLMANKIAYRNTEYILTSKGSEKINETITKTAVILAAGMGTRLINITKDEVPKGCLKIEGKTLVERSIEKLLKNGIEKVIIVTGHLNQFYDELTFKYRNIYTIKNNNYANTGSMASLAAAKDFIEEDFILLESDLIYEERALQEIQNTDLKDCVLLSEATYSGDEVFVEIRNDNIYKMSKDKHGLNSIYGELVGINKISKKLFDRMMLEYSKNTNSQYHYEYAIEDSAKEYLVGFKKIEDLIWAEIDDDNHLKRVLNKIVPKLEEKNEI